MSYIWQGNTTSVNLSQLDFTQAGWQQVDADHGRAFIFEEGSINTWTLVARLTADGGLTQKERGEFNLGKAGDRFGSSVAISDNYVAVGAPYADPSGMSKAGES